jgi:hypothetical protein
MVSLISMTMHVTHGEKGGGEGGGRRGGGGEEEGKKAIFYVQALITMP